MPTSTLERKISVNNFFQNSEEISDALNRINEKSDQALQKSDSAVAKAFSNENYLQSLLQTISTQNETIEKVSTENVTQTKLIERNVITQKEITQQVTNEITKIKKDDNDQTQEISKAFGILKGLYDSLGSAVQSLRSDVESISRYLLDEQKQRQQQLEQREFRIAQQKDVTEKRDILKSLSKSMGVGAQDTAGREGDLPRPGGEESFIKTLVQGALSAAGIGLGTMGQDGGDGDNVPGGNEEDIKPGTYSSGTYDVKKLTQLAKSVGMPEDKIPTMVAIALAESGGKTDAHNTKPPDNSYGLWQVNMYAELGPARQKEYGLKSYEELKDPVKNAKAAAKILKSQGLGAWSVYKNGSYKQYLPAAQKAYSEVKSQPQQQTQASQTAPAAGQQSTTQVAPAAGQQVSAAASEMKPGEEMAMRAPTGDVSAPFLGQVQSEKRSEAQPSISPMDTSSIVPFDYQPMQQVASSAGGSAQGSQGSQTNLSTTPDHPDAIPTNNPLTRMWTMSAINHLNINASMHHIYG